MLKLLSRAATRVVTSSQGIRRVGRFYGATMKDARLPGENTCSCVLSSRTQVSIPSNYHGNDFDEVEARFHHAVCHVPTTEYSTEMLNSPHG